MVVNIDFSAIRSDGVVCGTFPFSTQYASGITITIPKSKKNKERPAEKKDLPYVHESVAYSNNLLKSYRKKTNAAND